MFSTFSMVFGKYMRLGSHFSAYLVRRSSLIWLDVSVILPKMPFISSLESFSDRLIEIFFHVEGVNSF